MHGMDIQEISAQEVKQHLEKGELDPVHIIDVREPEEWITGHIPGAQLIPMSVLEYRRNELNPEQEYIIVCRSGNRSGIVCQYLTELGFNAKNMTGGMLDWNGDVETGM